MELYELINHSIDPKKVFYKSSKKSCSFGDFYKLTSKKICTPSKVTLINDEDPLSSLIQFFICLKSNSIPVIIPNSWNADLIQQVFGSKKNYHFFNDYDSFIETNQKLDLNSTIGILTSGSTSTPKVCLHNLKSIINSINSFQERFQLPGNTILGLSIPHYFSAGLLSLLRSYFLGLQIFSSKNLSDHIKEGTHFISLVPAQCFDLLKYEYFGQIKDIFIGGSKIKEGMILELKNKNVNIHLSYGMTEFATTVCSRTIDTDLSSSNLGRPLVGKQIKIDDNNNILITGDTRFLGYLKNGEIDNTQNSIWYKTNDRGYINENNDLILQGRSDRVIISGGINISLDKIEHCANELSEIYDIKCLSFEHEKWGESPALFYRSESEVTKLIIEHLKINLLPHEVPKTIINIDRHFPENRKISYDELISLIKNK